MMLQCWSGLQSHLKAQESQDPHSGSLVWLVAGFGSLRLLVGYPQFLAPWAAPEGGSLPCKGASTGGQERGVCRLFVTSVHVPSLLPYSVG